MSCFTIRGSGFGLYGYLPALIDSGQKIVLPYRYKQYMETRVELNPYIKHIEWIKNEQDILDYVEGAVLALPPAKQYEELLNCLSSENLQRFLLEKPLAQSPEQAIKLLKILRVSAKKFRIAYIFPYANWAKILNNLFHSNEEDKFIIRWSFLAHHYRVNIRTWKRLHSEGGGVIRFYGIHIIALLAKMGYSNIQSSEISGDVVDDYKKWHAIFTGQRLPQCEVEVDTESTTNDFRITHISRFKEKENKVVVNLKDPFDEATAISEMEDRRVPFISQLCHSLLKEPDEYDFYELVNVLWALVEEKTQFKIMPVYS